MIETVSKGNLPEFERFVREHPAGRFSQSGLYARQKPNWRWRAVLRRDARGETTGALSLLCRRVPVLPNTIVYGCRGPVCDPDDTETLRELLRDAAEFGRRAHAYVVRVDPAVTAADAAFLDAAAGEGFRVRRHRRFYEPMQARRLWRVPLEGPPSQVPRNFDEATTQSIRIALQRGVEVRQGGRELVADFAVLAQQESIREERVVRPAEYIAGFLENFGQRARLHVAYYENRPVAGAVVVTYGGRATVVFAADDGDITLRARYLLRTMILRQALEDGCFACEFPGLTADEDSPAYSFAAGFGGEAVEYAGELDLVLRPFVNFLAETVGVLWKYLRKKVYFFHAR